MREHIPVVYLRAGKKYIIYLDKERNNEEGEFHYQGIVETGTEVVEGWAKYYNFFRR